MVSIDLVQRAENILGISFNDVALLEQAFVHRSYLNENPGFALGSNERLEYLGDAVIGVIVSDALYHRYSTANEGDLTAMRAELVKVQTLGRTAHDLKLGDLLYLSRGEEVDSARKRLKILGQTFEALVGAIFLDLGFPVARDFVLKQLESELVQLDTRTSFRDAKSVLQESTQATTGTAPSYQVESAEGPGHRPRFQVTVRVEGQIVASGEGDSKQEAEQEAAARALDSWRKPTQTG
jgi:ribonuclease-3